MKNELIEKLKFAKGVTTFLPKLVGGVIDYFGVLGEYKRGEKINRRMKENPESSKFNIYLSIVKDFGEPKKPSILEFIKHNFLDAFGRAKKIDPIFRYGGRNLNYLEKI